MKKVKTILISLAVFWLVCYALMLLLVGIVIPPSPHTGDLSTQQMADPAQAVLMVSASTNVSAPVPVIEQNDKVNLFTRLILPASLVTVFAGLALACGYQLAQLGCRSYPPLPK